MQVALGAMHSLVLIYTPSRLMPAAAGMLCFHIHTGIVSLWHANMSLWNLLAEVDHPRGRVEGSMGLRQVCNSSL